MLISTSAFELQDVGLLRFHLPCKGPGQGFLGLKQLILQPALPQLAWPLTKRCELLLAHHQLWPVCFQLHVSLQLVRSPVCNLTHVPGLLSYYMTLGVCFLAPSSDGHIDGEDLDAADERIGED